jgi:hypothetical protein
MPDYDMKYDEDTYDEINDQYKFIDIVAQQELKLNPKSAINFKTAMLVFLEDLKDDAGNSRYSSVVLDSKVSPHIWFWYSPRYSPQRSGLSPIKINDIIVEPVDGKDVKAAYNYIKNHISNASHSSGGNKSRRRQRKSKRKSSRRQRKSMRRR